MESAYQRNAKTGRKATGKMKLKTIFAYRAGHLSTDLKRKFWGYFRKQYPDHKAGEKESSESIRHTDIGKREEKKRQIKKQNIFNIRQLAFKKERNPQGEYTRNIAYRGMLAAIKTKPTITTTYDKIQIYFNRNNLLHNWSKLFSWTRL